MGVNILDAIKANVARIRDEIARAAESSGRAAEEVTLVAVSKTVEPARIQAAFEAGIRHFGENRVQEAQEKIPLIQGPVTWHMVGHLQRNKAGHAVELFDMIQSVDTKRLAETISRRALQAGRRMDVLLGSEHRRGSKQDRYTTGRNRKLSGGDQGPARDKGKGGLMTIPPI